MNEATPEQYEKLANIEKYVIHKPILLKNLKDKLNQLVVEKRSSNTVYYGNTNSIIENKILYYN